MSAYTAIWLKLSWLPHHLHYTGCHKYVPIQTMFFIRTIFLWPSNRQEHDNRYSTDFPRKSYNCNKFCCI